MTSPQNPHMKRVKLDSLPQKPHYTPENIGLLKSMWMGFTTMKLTKKLLVVAFPFATYLGVSFVKQNMSNQTYTLHQSGNNSPILINVCWVLVLRDLALNIPSLPLLRSNNCETVSSLEFFKECLGIMSQSSEMKERFGSSIRLHDPDVGVGGLFAKIVSIIPKLFFYCVHYFVCI